MEVNRRCFMRTAVAGAAALAANLKPVKAHGYPSGRSFYKGNYQSFFAPWDESFRLLPGQSFWFAGWVRIQTSITGPDGFIFSPGGWRDWAERDTWGVYTRRGYLGANQSLGVPGQEFGFSVSDGSRAYTVHGHPHIDPGYPQLIYCQGHQGHIGMSVAGHSLVERRAEWQGTPANPLDIRVGAKSSDGPFSRDGSQRLGDDYLEADVQQFIYSIGGDPLTEEALFALAKGTHWHALPPAVRAAATHAWAFDEAPGERLAFPLKGGILLESSSWDGSPVGTAQALI